MHAVVYERHGGPEVLDYVEVPEPAPANGQVLVNVEVVGVNFRDVYEREGRDYVTKPPWIVGIEGAGTVIDTGQRVVWMGVQRSYAERVAADPNLLVPIPDGVSSEVAAAILLQGITAHYLVFESYPIQEGDWVIVHAAAGGVGLLLTQLAKLAGGRVIATTSTEEKGQLAREAGADEVLGYEGFVQRARDITGGGGVAAVYDSIGRSTFHEGLKALRPFGHMVLYGSSSGWPEPLDLHLLASNGSLYVQRPTVGTYTRTPQMLRDAASKVFELVQQDKLHVRIGARYPLAQARQAQMDLAARKTTGKILLEI